MYENVKAPISTPETNRMSTIFQLKKKSAIVSELSFLTTHYYIILKSHIFQAICFVCLTKSMCCVALLISISSKPAQRLTQGGHSVNIC